MSWITVTLPATGELHAVEEVSSKIFPGVKPVWGGSGVTNYIDTATPMPVASVANSFVSLSTASVDTNDTASITAALDVSQAGRIGVQVVGSTGAHTTHVVEVLGSVDDTNYVALSCEVTGEGIAQVDSAVSSIKAKVKTAEGGASACTIILFAK